jgi:predicted permease
VLSTLRSDLTYALRRIQRGPGFAAVAVLSLALGIGANTGMFSVVNAALLRGIPAEDPGTLVEVYTSESDGYAYSTSSHPDYLDARASTGAFESVIATRSFIARMGEGASPRVAFGELVSWDYFQALGVPMARGRSFVEEEDETPGTHPVAILGYRAWVRDFAADPGVIGEAVHLNGRAYTVVGVAPEAFTGSMPVLVSAVYVPLMMTNEIMGNDQLESRGSRSMFLKARLRPDASVEQANAQLAVLAGALGEQHPETNEGRTMSALPSGDVALHPLVDRVLTPVAGLLMAVVGLVLLIACANLASFLLARAEDRRREIAVRLAIGAGRGAIARQLFVESTLLALLGGAAGFVLAEWIVGLALALRPPLPLPIDFDVPLDRSVLAFTAGVSLFAGAALGLLPALQATRTDVASALKNRVGAGGARRRFDLRNALVVGQVAFSFALLIGAGLFVRSLQKAVAIDPGFDTGPAALLWPMPELSGYEGPEAVRAFYDQLEERLLAHPTVTAVALADRLPLGVAVQSRGYVLPGVPSDTRSGAHDIDNAIVNPGYFEAMGVEIVEGRAFDAADEQGSPVVVVSSAFADRYYPGESVVGRSIGGGGTQEMQIVGVAADTKVRTLGEAPRPYVYELRSRRNGLGMQVVVRGSGTGDQLVAASRQVLEAMDPNLVLFEQPKTMQDHLGILLFPPRMAATLLSLFGGVALLLSAIGIHGVVSYAVARRTRELGIRMSLGATARDLVRLAVGGGMRLAGLGGLIGIGIAGAATWAISGFLYGIGPTDVVTFVAIPALLGGVALLAAWLPARRATSVDPMVALRRE